MTAHQLEARVRRLQRIVAEQEERIAALTYWLDSRPRRPAAPRRGKR